MTMAQPHHGPAIDRRTGHQSNVSPLHREAQVERIAELLWLQHGAAAAWNVQLPAVQDSYRQMAGTLRAAVLAEVMPPSASDRTRGEIIRLRADSVEERARMAVQVERLQEYIRQLELRCSTDPPRVPRAVAGIQPEDLV
jgi:hypothetical protein